MIAKSKQRIKRVIKEISVHYKQISKIRGKNTAIIACSCFFLDFITRQKYMLYINYMRCVIRDSLNSIIECYPNNKKSYKTNHIFNKTPIWVCWLQGEEMMPEIVRMCLNSVKTHFPDDKCDIVVISLKNYSKYINIPRYVLDLLNNKTISYTNFSDILRFMLLKEYGGVWIDSTVLVTCDVPENMFEYSFFSQKSNNNYYKIRYASKNRWSSWLMYSKPDSLLFDFCTTILLEYLKEYDSFIDYYFIDYIIDISYERYDTIHKMIDIIPENNVDAFELVTLLNEPYCPDTLNQKMAACTFHKLTLHESFWEENNGKLSNYGYIKYLSE